MSEMKHLKKEDLSLEHKEGTSDYEYYKRSFLPRGYAEQCIVNIYEIPPQKSAYPYHYHHKNEEVFYIITGQGILKTPDGTREVSTGDLLYFPANEKGAHQLINTSLTEMLIYIDFDTYHDIDIAIYPESKKIGVWGKDINRLYKLNDYVDYYDDEI